ncbi:TRAP transporter substrate-binding protein [Pseudomaricurvus sp. HS19]|uniref:TRAP transporter substrate-binding protein n=1 Tax=Pseudomaricurvus sp. HS19 TaxID=2692626 RepID=UPI00136A16DD|nr:TRAP transporter substrate-binding protein [Pseudomaricurvus sp. HS19]MYM62803.1 DctP family TRAP transporter solute-binding subunit [Pseudomaricurvus sp. HS19]
MKPLLPLLRLRTCLVAILLTILCACGGQEKYSVLKLAHGLDQNHPTHKAMVYMAKRLEEISDGHLQMDIYPGGQLGEERELIELLQIGSLAMTKASASPMEGFVPDFKLFSLPYVFRDHDHFWRALESKTGRDLLSSGEAVRLRGLAYYDAGSRSFYTIDKPIQTPEDLSGLKIRVQQSITSVAMINTLGGSGTPVDWGELYTALQQGVVDGAENNPPSFYLSKHYEVARYLSLDEHTYVPDILLISRPIWNRLSPQQQGWLQQAAEESSHYQRKLWQEETERALQQLTADGVTIVHPDKAAFRHKVQPMLAEYDGTSVGAMIQAIRSLP